MIKKYYTVTILWGKSGRDCAAKLAAELKKRHVEEYVPINAFIFEKEALDSSSIMDDVIDKISKSSACVIILTFDDDNGTRVRQNILIETGIAWTKLGKEKLIFLSDKMNLPEDFPSNIRTEINTNFFDKSDPSVTVSKVCNELIASHRIKSTEKLLTSPEYIYDGRVLDDIEEFLGEEKADVQMRQVTDTWKNSVRNFDYLHERIMYVIERVAFFPVVGNDRELAAFMKSIRDLIVPTQLDREHMGDEGISAELRGAMNLTNQVIEYTMLKMQDETRQCIKNPLANRRNTEKIERKFGRIHQEIRNFIDDFESGKYSYNWLLRIVAYDYAALSKMKMYDIDIKPESEENQRDLYEAIEYFEKARDLAQEKDVESGHIWLGFLQYNLARAYHRKYNVTGEEGLIDDIKDNLLDAIGYREEWSQNEYYKGIFATALSYEYFLASHYDYALRNDLKGYSDETAEENLENVMALRETLNHYCDESELGILYRMRDQIDELIERIHKNSENE